MRNLRLVCGRGRSQTLVFPTPVQMPSTPTWQCRWWGVSSKNRGRGTSFRTLRRWGVHRWKNIRPEPRTLEFPVCVMDIVFYSWLNLFIKTSFAKCRWNEGFIIPQIYSNMGMIAVKLPPGDGLDRWYPSPLPLVMTHHEIPGPEFLAVSRVPHSDTTNPVLLVFLERSPWQAPIPLESRTNLCVHSTNLILLHKVL